MNKPLRYALTIFGTFLLVWLLLGYAIYIFSII